MTANWRTFRIVLVSVIGTLTARDGSAFPAVECPWPYIRPANE
jgi:hypothetical protein